MQVMMVLARSILSDRVRPWATSTILSVNDRRPFQG